MGKTVPVAIDLFAGAGGATLGLKDAGFRVVAAVENDADAAATYRMNHPEVALDDRDIRKVTARGLRRRLNLDPGELALLKACPPCQEFSSLAVGESDRDRCDLVLDVVRFAREFRPQSVLIENVPGLKRDPRFQILVSKLAALGYFSRHFVVDAQDLGVPQRRRRLIVIAVRRSQRSSLPETFIDTIRDEFDVYPMTAGEALAELSSNGYLDDPLDVFRSSGPKVRARIKAIPINGNRFSLPRRHQLDCHKRLTTDAHPVRNATASYGRVQWKVPAPTMTTRCTTPACGSFIHPRKNRGLTLREAATFQTFPFDYQFEGGYDSVERQIGNAVPVRMACVLGAALLDLLL